MSKVNLPSEFLVAAEELMNALTTRGAGRGGEHRRVNLVWVQGRPGFGKSWFAQHFKEFVSAFGAKWGFGAVALINLDHLGSVKDGKWIIDVKKLKSEIIFHVPSDKKLVLVEGICDNMDEVAAVVRPFAPLSLVVVPSYNRYKSVMDLRGRELTQKGTPWSLQVAESFKKSATMTEREFSVMLKSFIATTAKHAVSWRLFKTGEHGVPENGYFKSGVHQVSKDISDGRVGTFEVILHPKRQPDSAKHWKNANKRSLLLVDGITQNTIEQEILDRIIAMRGSDVNKLSVHAKTGVYNGEEFDNSTHAKTTLVGKKQVLMIGTSAEDMW